MIYLSTLGTYWNEYGRFQKFSLCELKGIFSDTNIFLWHELEDIIIKKLFLKFWLIQINSCPQDFMWKLLSFHTKNDFSSIPMGKCASWKRATNRCKNLNFLTFLRASLYEIWEYSFKSQQANVSVALSPWYRRVYCLQMQVSGECSKVLNRYSFISSGKRHLTYCGNASW